MSNKSNYITSWRALEKTELKLKIITWNCNGALRKKFENLTDFNADIHIIQECENPAETKHKEYNECAENYLWIGDTKNKGIGIFAKKKHRTE